LLFNLAKNERKHFEIKYDKETNEYTLGFKGDVNKALSQPHTEAFAMLVLAVNHPDTIKVAIADNCLEKGAGGNTVQASSENGGRTLRASESLSGEVEVYLARNGAKEPATGTDGKPIHTPKSIVAAHEVFGHGLDLISIGVSSEVSAVIVENLVRTGRGLPVRAQE
jgi:hypothetical protein